MRFPLVSTIGVLGLGVLLAAPAGAADLVIYRTPEGQLVLSNRPLPAGVELFFRVPDRNQLGQRSEEGAAAGAPSRQALAPAGLPPEPLPPTLQERREVLTPHTTPVDTVALALIKRGMSAADVRGTLGAPTRVVELDPVVRVSSDRSSATAGRLEQSVWMYPGNTQMGGALIWFVNSHVERVERVW